MKIVAASPTACHPMPNLPDFRVYWVHAESAGFFTHRRWALSLRNGPGLGGGHPAPEGVEQWPGAGARPPGAGNPSRAPEARGRLPEERAPGPYAAADGARER